MLAKNNHNIETCFSPTLFPLYQSKQANVVIVDVFRASTSICTAFMNGVKTIIPVSSIEEAMSYRNQGYLVAAERDGLKLDFADIGNSPDNFSRDFVHGKVIVYCTTNGTKCFELAKNCHSVTIGSFLNVNALCDFLVNDGRSVVIFCAGWKGKFNLEDSMFAGTLACLLLEKSSLFTSCDATKAALDLWEIAKPDPLAYVQKCAHHDRLLKNGLANCIEYCLSFNKTNLIPIYLKNQIKLLHPNTFVTSQHL